MSRPCSSHVYQDRPTPARPASSSRRRPGVRRRPPPGRPTLSGVVASRWRRRKSASWSRRVGGGASPRIDALLVPGATVAQGAGMTTTPFLGDKPVHRIGFGAMQLAGPGVFGPPRDPAAARAVLRRAIELGVDHIDTSQYYGPDVVNDLIRESLHPYPEDLKLVTKVGARRDEAGGWLPAQSPAELRAGVDANLRSLQVERLDLVNLRLVESPDDVAVPLEEQLSALEDMREQGKLDLIGLSNIDRAT